MSKVETPSPLTLRDLLSTAILGSVEIINECNETLIATRPVETVVPLYKVLNDELLNRSIISYGSEGGVTIFKVKGMEDAE